MSANLEKVITAEDTELSRERERFKQNRERVAELEFKKAEKERMLRRAEQWVRVYLGNAVREYEFWNLEARILSLQVDALEEGRELTREEAQEIIAKEDEKTKELLRALKEAAKRKKAGEEETAAFMTEEEKQRWERVKLMYREIARKTHPDLFPGDAARRDIFRKAAEAWQKGDLNTIEKLWLSLEGGDFKEEGAEESKVNLQFLRERNVKLERVVAIMERELEELENHHLMPFATDLFKDEERAAQWIEKQKADLLSRAEEFRIMAADLYRRYQELMGSKKITPPKVVTVEQLRDLPVRLDPVEVLAFIKYPDGESQALEKREKTKMERFNELVDKLATFVEENSAEGPITEEELAEVEAYGERFFPPNRCIQLIDTVGRKWKIFLHKYTDNTIIMLYPVRYFEYSSLFGYRFSGLPPSIEFFKNEGAFSQDHQLWMKRCDFTDFEVVKKEFFAKIGVDSYGQGIYSNTPIYLKSNEWAPDDKGIIRVEFSIESMEKLVDSVINGKVEKRTW